MRSTKTFNNISDELRKQIPKLKHGERVVFQLINGVPNTEPDEKEKAKQGAVLYGKRQLITHFNIYDKHLKDESGNVIGGFVEVGCVDVWVRDMPEKFRTFIPGLGGASFFQGKFELVGGKVADEELYEILWLSPERKGTPCPDDNIEQIFEIMNVKAEGQKTLSRVDSLYEVLGIVKTASPADMAEYMAAINQPTYQDPEVLRAKVSELAKSEPEQFLKQWKASDRKQRATIKEAFDAGIITYNEGAFKIGKATVAKMKVDDLAMVSEIFSKWISSEINGSDVLKNIENQLKESKAEVA